MYRLKTILKFRWESGFLKGGPLCTNGRSEYLMQLNVNDTGPYGPGANGSEPYGPEP